MIYLDLNTSIGELHKLLLSLGWLHSKKEKILKITKPGEGNMNVVMRVHTNQRSFILKQSRPYVQKFQDIRAPLNRIDVERQFYLTIGGSKMSKFIPKILAYNAPNYLLMLSDLGNCDEMSYVYNDRKIEPRLLTQLVNMIGLVHNTTASKNHPKNRSLRSLNHQHIFELPFTIDNGFDLDSVQSGLQSLSISYKNDAKLTGNVKEVAALYLSDEGKTLIHGDYYPGSWMKSDNQVFLIDPEFSFLGFAEFDVGVMGAHLTMATMNFTILDQILVLYNGKIDRILYQKIVGIELMRRLIGLAQLPLFRTLEEKDFLLKSAYKMIVA